MARVLMVVSPLTCVVSGWMFVMYLVLRHPGFAWRAGLAAAVCAGSAAALAAVVWRVGPVFRAGLAAWAVGLAAVGAWALITNGSATDPDTWVDIAAALFVLQGLLTIATLAWGGPNTLRDNAA